MKLLGFPCICFQFFLVGFRLGGAELHPSPHFSLHTPAAHAAHLPAQLSGCSCLPLHFVVDLPVVTLWHLKNCDGNFCLLCEFTLLALFEFTIASYSAQFLPNFVSFFLCLCVPLYPAWCPYSTSSSVINIFNLSLASVFIL